MKLSKQIKKSYKISVLKTPKFEQYSDLKNINDAIFQSSSYRLSSNPTNRIDIFVYDFINEDF